MNIEIWSLGKENDSFIEAGIQFYLKRLKPYCAVQYIFIPPPKRSASMDPEASKKREGELILGRLQAHHYLILLDERGEELRSLKWAEEISKFQNDRVRTLVFLIGGPWGIAETVRQAAKRTWSLSTLTFPHQLVRLLMAEQLYRCFSILQHSAYHHE
jgi:23S rRNA (pseudouridine1915-N3)-methyltransferase